MTIPDSKNLQIDNFELKLPFSASMVAEIKRNGRLVTFEKDTVVFREGEITKWGLILVEGSVQCFHRNFESDREFMLYEVAPKDPSKLSCVTFYDNETRVNMLAVAKQGSTLLYIPVDILARWAETSLEWNTMVVQSFREIFEALVSVLKSTGTTTMEERIIYFLKCRTEAADSQVVKITHQQIANSLGTSRVVVSRILKDLESRGNLELLRGQIRMRCFGVDAIL